CARDGSGTMYRWNDGTFDFW
nr:immunoglobulin heavy chain junction region [Macaca mulatta]MOV45037.1 immunoglobulin heavy chain junction region [Macaca mulatta]MOV45459.1 immunoglobulin heavy chain junction region [Macaca mulatta]MOV46678.1 immunoglobulin heavy chain junction region [Macaca mulatta]